MNVFIEKLRSNTSKITPQRLAVYEIIKDSTDHPNAEMVFNKLSSDYPTMSLATVYKSLELFSELDLIQIINIGENSFRYDGNTLEHQHIVCTKCSKVEDINNDIFDDIFENLRSEVGAICNYEIHRQQLCFYGLCSICLEKCAMEQITS